MNPIEQFVSWLGELFGKGWQWCVDQIQVPEPPAWAHDAVASVSGIAAMAAKFSFWVPWEVFVPVMLLVVGCLVAAIIIKVVRIIASFFTLGGGSAA